MHDQRLQDVRDVLHSLSDAEKLELIAELARSVRAAPPPKEDEAQVVARQKAAWEDLRRQLEELPPAPEPDDGLVGSRDHDKILYDGLSHTGFPEKPTK